MNSCFLFRCIFAFAFLYTGLLYSCNHGRKLWTHKTYKNMRQSQVTMREIKPMYQANNSDNIYKNQPMQVLYMNQPSRSILNHFAKALPFYLQQRAVELHERMLPAGGGMLISLCIRTDSDRKVGNMMHKAYRPHLLCAKAIQTHFDNQGITSAVFLHSDSMRVQDAAHSLGLKYLTTLDPQTELSDFEHTLLAWLLLGAGNVVLGADASAFSRTAAQRTGAFLYQLPVHAVATEVYIHHNHTPPCSNGLLRTHTRDTTHVLVPNVCADLFPGCPVFALEHAYSN